MPEQRFLSEDESVAATVEFRRRHPWRVRLFSAILGWGDLLSEAGVREFVRTRPFVVFRPGEDDPTLGGAQMALQTTWAVNNVPDTHRRTGATIVAALVRGVYLLLAGRVRFPKGEVGRVLTMEDGEEFTVFRHAQVTGAGDPGAVFLVRFTPAHMSVRGNMRFSLLPMIPLLGMRGFREKYWCVNKLTGMCLGVYAWQTRADAEAYSQSVALRFMTGRSHPGSVSFRIIDQSQEPYSLFDKRAH